MSSRRVGWLVAAVVLAVIVAVQVTLGTRQPDHVVALADAPTIQPGVDVLAGVAEVPVRVRLGDYRRAAFGEAWDDDNSAPGGHNGCDTRFLGGFGVLSEALQNVRFKPRTLR